MPAPNHKPASSAGFRVSEPDADADTEAEDRSGLPPGAPIWATLLQQQDRRASRERGEQLAVLRELTTAVKEHNSAAADRSALMLEALRSRDHGAEKAMKELAAEKTMLRRWAEVATKELWGVFRVPIGMLVTGAATFYAWQHFQIPTTPTPVSVQVAPPPDPDGAP
jgi:hypothetical protein